MSQDAHPLSESFHWLTLSQAAETLGIHPSTLRRWADEGEICCIRTPGGHRRFLESDLRGFLKKQTENSNPSPPEVLTQSLVRKARRELESQPPSAMSWHAAFDENECAARRASGRRLLGLAIQFTSRRRGREIILDEARCIGRRYGQDAAERQLSLVDTLKAFLFFRETVIRSARPGLYSRGQYDAEDVHIHRSLRRFLDEVLFAAMRAYEQKLQLSLPTERESK